MTPTQDSILISLLRYYYLTARQCTRLLGYAPTSLEHVQGILRSLVRSGHLVVEELPRPKPTTSSQRKGGSGQYVFKLTRKSHTYLAQLGYDVPARARAYLDHADPFLTHSVEVSEFLLAAELLSQSHPQIRLTAMRHDRDLQRLRTTVTVADGPQGEARTVRYTPDGYLCFLVSGQPSYEAPFVFELDRATENQGKWRRRVREMVAYHHGPHRDTFGQDYLTVAIITTAGFSRLKDLHRWTHAELSDLRASADDWDLFRFASFALAPTIPDERRPRPGAIFLGSHWYRLGTAEPVALLEEAGAAD